MRYILYGVHMVFVLYTYLTEHQEKFISSFASCPDTFQLLNPLLLIHEEVVIASLPRCFVSMLGWCGVVTSCLDRWVGPPTGADVFGTGVRDHLNVHVHEIL
jgi:hypothetical protein